MTHPDAKELDRPAPWRDPLLVIALLGSFAVSNIGIMLLLETSPAGWGWLFDLLVYGFYGSIYAQIALHSIWTVFSNRRWVWRMLLSAAAALCLAGSLVIPNATTSEFVTREELLLILLILVLCLPIFLFAAQSPLWVARAALGWHVVGPGSQHASGAGGRLSVAALLLATAAIAVALAGLRLASSLVDIPVVAFFGQIAIGCGLLCIASLATTIPCIVATLRARRIARALLITAVLSTCILIVGIVLISIPMGPPSPDDLLPLGMILLSYYVLMTTPMLIARRLGYRLQTRRDSRATNRDPVGQGQVFDGDAESPTARRLAETGTARPIDEPEKHEMD